MTTICDQKKPQQDELELDRLAEAELCRLQRQFRIMEGDRVAFAEETGAKLRKQKQVIQNLKDEKTNILTDLKVASSTKNKRYDRRVIMEIQRLLGEQKTLQYSIKTQRSHIDEIEYQIKKVLEQIKVYEWGPITDVKCQQRVVTAQRMVSSLENKLEVVTKKFNTVLAENDKLREEIDHLIKERAHFNMLWTTLIGNLKKGKKFMMDLVEQATLAYDQREEWCNKLQALKDRGRQDLIIHTQEMRDLQRRLDNDTKLQTFLGIKGQKRIMADLNEREAARRREIRSNLEHQLEKYRETFKQIKEFSCESNIERLAAQFVKQEEENFALFNYVNELNYELETLNDSVDELHQKIDAQRTLNETRAVQQHDRLEELQAELESATQDASDMEAKLRESETLLETTMKGIENIFQMVKCNNAPILELLGDNTHVTIYNSHLFLGILEKRTIELINKSYYKDKFMATPAAKGPVKATPQARKQLIKEPQGNKMILMTMEKVVKTNPCPLCVELEQVSDVVEVLQEPLLRHEVQEKLDFRLTLPDAEERLHNVSACHLPASRAILQKRYM